MVDVGMIGFGIADDVYIAPRCGLEQHITASSFPKASLESGGLFQNVIKASKVPGPEAYNKDLLKKSFAEKAKLGSFSKLTRGWGISGGSKGAAVGQYDSVCASQVPKVKGGIISKAPRGCYLFDKALKGSQNTQAPGKYNADQPSAHQPGMAYTMAKTESRRPKKATAVGPGYYHINYDPCEKQAVSNTLTKEALKSFLDRMIKGKDKTPGPGHMGIPEPKVQDRQGQSKHTARLLADRQSTPTGPRSSTPRQGTPRQGVRSATPRGGNRAATPREETRSVTPSDRPPAMPQVPMVACA